MIERHNAVRVAVVQAAPVLFNREASTEKLRDLTEEVSNQGARLILFPEAFIPAYPRGLSFGTVVGGRTASGRRTWQRYWANAGEVPGPATKAIGAAAKNAGVYLAVGVVERDNQFGRGTLYCSVLYFGPDGRLLGKHRKLKPTGAERLIWGEGDGSMLTVVETEFGRIGGLICWENYMPPAGWHYTARGSNCILPRPRMRAIHGRRRCAISRVRDVALFWGVTSLSRKICIQLIWRGERIWLTTLRWSAEAEALSFLH